MKKVIITLLAAVLVLGLAGTAAFAEEAPAQEQTQEQKVFTSANGVVSIEAPADHDNWVVMKDDEEGFVIGDGKDVIGIQHFSRGETIPALPEFEDEIVEIIQYCEYTKDETFVVVGLAMIPEEVEYVREAVQSFKVLQYGTKKAVTAAEAEEKKAPGPVYTVEELNMVLYCTEPDGVNVRTGYSRDDKLIGGFHYGDQVPVTGRVLKDGAPNGWIRVNYNGQTGYTWAEYYQANMPAPAPAPEPQTKSGVEDELIHGGQIFTGNEQALYTEDGRIIYLKELNQGGWADDQTGVIYTQEAGGGSHFYGSDGSVLVTEYYYRTYIAGNENYESEELIHGGQIFSGNTMTLYAPEGGGVLIEVQELNQGGWADPQTGVIYTQEGGGGYHFYGSDGSVWVTAAYFAEHPVGSNGLD